MEKIEVMAHDAAERLRAYVARIERLEEEKANLADDIRRIYAEAKGNGFDAATIRNGRRRAQDRFKRPRGADEPV